MAPVRAYKMSKRFHVLQLLMIQYNIIQVSQFIIQNNPMFQ